IRKSDRSLIRPRKPARESVLDELIRRIPWKSLDKDGKISLANFATLPPTGIVNELVRPVEVPSSRNTSRRTVAAVGSAFAMANPLWMDPTVPRTPEFWMYVRNWVPRVPVIAASETLTPPEVNEKTPRGIGVRSPAVGVIRTDPVCNGPALGKRNLRVLLPGME